MSNRPFFMNTIEKLTTTLTASHFFLFLTFRSNSKKKKEKGKEKINTSRDSNGTPMAPFPL